MPKDEPNGLVVFLVHATGMRVSEALGQRWADLDLDRGLLRLRTQLDPLSSDHRGIHHLRHTYGTTLAESGVHERVAQQLLGHADSRTTREIYTHVGERMMDHAVQAISAAVDRAVGAASGSRDRPAPRDGSGNEETAGR